MWLRIHGSWRRWSNVVAVVALSAAIAACTGGEGSSESAEDTGEVSVQQIREIAKQAYIYGYPMVDNYRVQYAYFVDEHSPQFVGPWNRLHSDARVYTPADTTIQTPNSDTP